MDEIITLNVGGHLHTTSLTTLTKYPDSMLGAMFSGRMTSAKDHQGNYVIDRDGTLFRFILNFLRTSTLSLPEDFRELESLAKEAEFYQINELVEIIREQQKMDTSLPAIVTLNVGGYLYTTSLTTLTKYPDSMLGAMFSGRMPSAQDHHGHYLIDRDGVLFRYILNFLRTSALTLPDEFKEIDLLVKEAEFYQIKELVEIVRSLQRRKNSIKKRDYIEIVMEDPGNWPYCTFLGREEILGQVQEISNYLNSHTKIDRVKLFEELQQLGFVLQFTNMSMSTFEESGSQIRSYTRWVYIR